MSERYPAISQLIAENRIPEFDCLYLDMNGIIHNCTHKDSDSPTFRLTEDQMFIAIFNYIEHLFGKIKPKQLFFMAIDGVAPRAKMNQQRARRFRTALDAENAKEKAIKQGVEMPKEEAFDSNCITPGTGFMAKLTQQLKYFINKKVSEDVDWQGVEVVLSGHEVPGEGEHKIMEYIRQARSQPGYHPNIRHCLYGLDADLIMLGLLSHDPHFCLLREEVTFGRQNQKKSKELEHQNFYLMHLCIVREYLELEFQELKEPGLLKVPFDLEQVIDDFILMAFFVGNDFLPNLPNLHINEGALAAMFKKYKEVLPKLDGYINEKGVINLQRLAVLLDALSDVEFRFFEAENSDQSWLRGKQKKGFELADTPKPAQSLTLSTPQKKILKLVKSFVTNRTEDAAPSLDLPASLAAGDRKFVQQLADDLKLKWATVQDGAGDRHLQLQFPTKPVRDDEDDDEEEDEESQIALNRVIKRYDNAKVVDVSADEVQADFEKKYQEKFQKWKDEYYQEKFPEWAGTPTQEAEMQDLTENYVQGLQWVLFYYYRGIASWPWFYKYHYSPMISDVKKGINVNMNFTLGRPFRPFQQLMGVLPDRSKKIVPEAYHPLMTSADSPIIDFYPRDFELDMNGKKMEWEAVVKIPFIDEKRLLNAMSTKDPLLTPEEKARNDFGVSLKFTYSPDVEFTYPSSLQGVFPNIEHCRCIENVYDLPTMDGVENYVGLVEGVKLGEAALAGFPSLKVLPHNGQLGFHAVNVFQQDSRNESMVVTLVDPEKRAMVEEAKKKLSQSVHVGYPFLQEAKVMRVSDELFDYILATDGSGQVISKPHTQQEIDAWHRKAERIEGNYSKRLGLVIGSVESLLHVDQLKGLKKTDEGATIKEFAQIPGQETDFASQVVVDEVISRDERYIEKAAISIKEEFPEGARAFFLGEFNYGRPLEVVRHDGERADIWVSAVKGKEPDFGREIARQAEKLSPYTPSYAVARLLGLNALVLAKITSSFQVTNDDQKVNLGLNLKFEAKKLKVLGYSRRGQTGWEFSNKAIDLLSQYMTKFPEFIACIQRNPQNSNYDATDFYPPEIAKTKIKEIQAWLKEIEAKAFERVPLEAEQLDSDVVMRMEQEADKVANSVAVEGKKVKSVPRNALLKPSDAEHRLGNQHFSLGDRVVYAQDSGRVPIATRGTVVGMTRTPRTVLLDVVFDVTFMSGTSLGDRCSPFRGSTVPVSSVLNITDRQLIAGSKAGSDRRPQSSSQPLSTAGYGMPLGPNGQGQLQPAAVPPPFRGSFSGIASGRGGHMNGAAASPRGNGFARGGRGAGFQGGRSGQQQGLPVRSHPSNPPNGRANGNVGHRGARGSAQPVDRRGYTPLDPGTDDTAGMPRNPKFASQDYSTVPPPASLDARGGGGRGRGRGGIRGNTVGGPRGRGGPTVGGQQRGRGTVRGVST